MDLSSASPLVNALENPADALRLVNEWRDALVQEGKLWAEFSAGRVRQSIEERSFQGRIWPGPGEDSIALAGWEMAGEIGRRGWLYLADGYRNRSVLEQFLKLIESPTQGDSPFVSWADDIPGVSPADREAVFTGRGFSPVVRADMRYPKRAIPRRQPPDELYPVRSLTLGDEPMIADLLYRTYAAEPERALFATLRDPREDARHGTHNLLHGDVGRWLPEASFGIERDGRLVAQTLANDLEGGLITEVDVDPAFRRRGLARRLLPHTIDALRSEGFDVPRLVVTMWNPRAVRLYQSLGFEFVSGGDGRLWLNLSALGIPAPRG